MGNTCGPSSNFSYIDDPSLNGNPDAHVFITAIVGIQPDRSNINPNSIANLTYTGGLAFGTCPADRWVISGGDISVGAEFNVMVVGP